MPLEEAAKLTVFTLKVTFLKPDSDLRHAPPLVSIDSGPIQCRNRNMQKISKSVVSSLAVILTCLLGSATWAGRPVFETINRDELIVKSDFIFSGYPSPQKSKIQCSNESGRWQVHKVYRGDKSLEGSIISIADHGYRFFRDSQGKPIDPPSFRAFKFRDGMLNRNSFTSILFTTRNKDGCFELAAQGAQESFSKAVEVQSLLSLPLNCEETKRAFEFRVSTFPKSCKQDSDCGSFYVHPNSCEPPMILSQAANADMKSDEFIRLQSNFRLACAQQWSQQPACSPIQLPFRCKNSVCEKGLSAAKAVAVPPLNKARITDSCAPNDATAAQIVVQAGEQEYPMLSVNWWSDSHPISKGGVYQLQSKGSRSYEQGYHATYCSFKMGCKELKDIKLKVDLKTGGTDGTLEFEFTTQDGENKKGQVPVHYQNGPTVYCG